MPVLNIGESKYFAGKIDYRLRTALEHLPLENISHSLEFLRVNCEKPKLFLDFINKPEFIPIVKFTEDFHKNDIRKVTGDPYIKHLLYAAFLCFRSPDFWNYNDADKRIFIAGAFLHDAIEMKEKKGNFKHANLLDLIKSSCSNEEEARRIVTISSLLTPLKKPKKYIKDEWLKIKLTDFRNIINTKDYEVLRKYNRLFPSNTISIDTAKQLAGMITKIKIADDSANIRETVDDVTSGRDKINKKPNGIVSLGWRVEDFQNRISIIRNTQHDSRLLPQLMKDLLFLQEALLQN